jgi:phosphatidylserine decarboxylase
VTGYLIAGAALAHATALPLAWKWHLGILRVALVVLAGSMIVAIAIATFDHLVHFTVVTGTVAMWAATLFACAACLLIVFFRDPDRVAPDSNDFIVSPADGQIIYVREIQPGQVPVADKKGRAYPIEELSGTRLADAGAVAVGISMNLSDVHVNRAPIAGRVTLVRHVAGTFGSLRNPEMMFSNERATTIIDAGGLQVALVQIASRLVRRIVTFVSEGEATQVGQRIGAIRFGSQVDLIVPAAADIRLVVQTGDRVVAGRTVVAVVTSRSAALPQVLSEAKPG